MKVLFLDESGDHNLSVIDKQYPLFILGGVIVDKLYAETVLTQKINEFKEKVFGRRDIILHTADITRNRNGFEKIKDKEFRQFFYDELNALMQSLEYKVIACVIKKDEHLSKYGVAALDPYFLSLDILVERFALEIGNVADGGIIVAERREPTLDHELDLAWLNLKIQGTRYLQAKQIENRILSLNLRSKKDNIAGLQLADLVLTPIGRSILGKGIKKDFEIIEQKFRKDKAGIYKGYGLITLPK